WQRALGSKALAVEGDDVQALEIDVIEAAHVDRDHLGAVGPGAARERADAAVLAKEVMDDFAVELVVPQRIFAALQHELLVGRRGHEHAALAADGAVAGHDLAQVDLGLVTDAAAMASPGIGLGLRHRVSFALIVGSPLGSGSRPPSGPLRFARERLK